MAAPVPPTGRRPAIKLTGFLRSRVTTLQSIGRIHRLISRGESSFVFQLRGPHVSVCPRRGWRSNIAVIAAHRHLAAVLQCWPEVFFWSITLLMRSGCSTCPRSRYLGS